MAMFTGLLLTASLTIGQLPGPIFPPDNGAPAVSSSLDPVPLFGSPARAPVRGTELPFLPSAYEGANPKGQANGTNGNGKDDKDEKNGKDDNNGKDKDKPKKD